ncbi:MAG TPA: endoribonuclease MazF [Thermoanaerobaculia bacterium]|nr:endoribonuclease MazF [Thermoanaerobaculia bacterium]
MRAYVPERGEVVWLTFTPQAGHEQAGRRPALVLSPAAYNGKVGLALLCPITRQAKGYPFEVALPTSVRIEGVILADQVKSLDWRARQAERVGRVPAATLDEVTQKVLTLLGSDG